MVESISTIVTASVGVGVVRDTPPQEKKQEVAKAAPASSSQVSDNKLQLALKQAAEDNAAPAEHSANTKDFAKLAENFINNNLPDQAPNTKLRIDQDDYGNFIYQGVDVKSGEVVQQFPSDEVLNFISYYRDKEGIVVDEEA